MRVQPSRERVVLLVVAALAALGVVLGLAVPIPHVAFSTLRQQMLDLVRVLATTTLAISLVLGPGLALRASPVRRRIALGFLPLPGIAALVLTACAAWALAPSVSPRLVCSILLIPVLAWTLIRLFRAGLSAVLDAEERYVLLIVGIALGVAIARTLWSLGPSGELLAGTSFRTFEVGDRSDSRLPYGIVQLVAHGNSPFGRLARGYFQGYTFSDRGALSGLASAPAVLLTGGRPPVAVSGGPWSPFDADGFQAFRLTVMTLSATALLSVWTLARRIAGERAGRLAVLLAASTPFVIHELWFTWPKLLAGSFVLLAAVALLSERPLGAGLLLGIGYLTHPIALLSLPALGLLAVWPLTAPSLRHPRIRTVLWLGAGLLVCLVAWRLVNWSHYTQGSFFQYFKEAGRSKTLHDTILRAHGGHPAPVTLSAWIVERLRSVANTLVPLRLVFASAHDQWINSALQRCFPFCSGGSPAVVHFSLQYWTTVPFGLGIVFFPLLLAGLWQALRRCGWAVSAAVIVPFVMFALYWGETATGMLREGLHAWVLTVIVVLAVEQQRRRFSWLRHGVVRMLLALRSVEVLLAAMLATVVTRHRLIDAHFRLSDSAALVAMCALCGCLGGLIWGERAPREDQATGSDDRLLKT